jgi:opacity protein-like surface antigen
MNRSMLTVLAAAIAISLPVVACAADEGGDSGFYISGAAGVTLEDDQLINGFNAAGAPRRIVTDMDRGKAFNGAFGYRFAENAWGRIRTEAEIGRNDAELDALSLNGINRALIGSPDKSLTTGMINVFYDTPTFLGPVRAEFGAGVGRGKLDYNVRYNVTATGPSIEIPTDASETAYQYVAGLSGELTDGLELFAQWRYMKLKDHKVERFNRTAGVRDSVLDAEYSARSVMIGLRYTF